MDAATRKSQYNCLGKFVLEVTNEEEETKQEGGKWGKEMESDVNRAFLERKADKKSTAKANESILLVPFLSLEKLQ